MVGVVDRQGKGLGGGRGELVVGGYREVEGPHLLRDAGNNSGVAA